MHFVAEKFGFYKLLGASFPLFSFSYMENKLQKGNGFIVPVLKYFTGRNLGGWFGGSITLLSGGYKYP